jgi:hypothetical protein
MSLKITKTCQTMAKTEKYPELSHIMENAVFLCVSCEFVLDVGTEVI